MASKAAKACVQHEVSKHCRKKRGKGCKSPAVRAQAVAIGFSICRRRGFKLRAR
ncbi:MAG: DUF6496 domain-containing protein [Tepidisphaeraceae bacterium]